MRRRTGEDDPRGAFVVKQIVLADRLELVECLPDDALAFTVRAADQTRSLLTLQVVPMLSCSTLPLASCVVAIYSPRL